MTRHQASRVGMVVVAAGLLALCCSPKGPAPSTVARGPTNLEQSSLPSMEEDSTSARLYVYNPGKLRDPFVRPGTRSPTVGSGEPAEPTPPPLHIEAIALAANPRAIINGRSVGVGDVIDGAKIVRITNNSVEIEFNNKRHTIPYR